MSRVTPRWVAVAAVVAGAVSLSACGTTPASTSTSTTSTSTTTTTTTTVPTHYSATPTVVDGRFTAPFELDQGGLLVTPVSPSYRAVHSFGAASAEAWSTRELQSYQPYALGLGVVSVTKPLFNHHTVKPFIAWVGLAHAFLTYSCPVITVKGHPKKVVTPPDNGWSAVVFGDALGSPSFVYVAARVICDGEFPSSLSSANETISTPWVLTSRGVVVTEPSCATRVEVNFSSSPSSTTFGYFVTIPESNANPATWASSTLPTCLSDPSTKRVNLSGNPYADGVVSTTHHQPPGLVRMVSGVFTTTPPS